jgi:Na+/H+-dicarboxylate symporter
MDANIGLIVALALPIVLFLALRINAAMVFLSLCLGQVLVLYVASEAMDILRGSMHSISQVSTSTMQLCVLLAPAVVTAILAARSVHGRVKNVANFFPAVGASALGVLLAVPLLPTGLRHTIQAQPTWHYLSNAEALVVGVGGLVSLLFLWTQRRHMKQPEKHKKH